MLLKKRVFIIVLISLANTCINAQEGMVKYRQAWNPDAVSADRNIREIPSFLYFKNERSLYVYNRSKDMEPGLSAMDMVNQGYDKVNFEQSDPYGNMFYKDFSKGNLIIRQLLFGAAYLTEEPLPAIKWVTTSGEKIVANYKCKKANARFRGRTYEAWYAPGIPLNNGPWKFQGLPGLILEVCDSNKEICFYAESVTIPYKTKNDLLVPANGKQIPFEDFKSIEYIKGQKIIDSLRTALNLTDDNQIRFQYSPVERSYD